MHISIAEWDRKNFIAVGVIIVSVVAAATTTATADCVVIIQYCEQWHDFNKKICKILSIVNWYKVPVKVLHHV